MILDLLRSDGLNPKPAGQSEYFSPCPACGGDDRFRIWPERDRYWCRQCERSGDAIQYLRDFHGMTFKAAASAVGKVIPGRSFLPCPAKKKRNRPKPPAPTWQDKAADLVKFAHAELLKNDKVLNWLKNNRGLHLKTVKRFKLGWLDKQYFPRRKEWDLPDKEAAGKTIRKMLVPAGLVIPCLEMGKVIRVRIRAQEKQGFGRYYVLPGSSMMPMIIGELDHGQEGHPAIIVESELDALLMSQEIKSTYVFIALGTAGAKPTDNLAGQLKDLPFLIICLDSDQAGNKATKWWLEKFENAAWFPMPGIVGKDPTEACQNGLNFKTWLNAASIAVTNLGGKPWKRTKLN